MRKGTSAVKVTISKSRDLPRIRTKGQHLNKKKRKQAQLGIYKIKISLVHQAAPVLKMKIKKEINLFYNLTNV